MGRRHSITSGLGGVQLSLIVTPMLDMSFQILAFFIMTYHPSALEGHIDGNLLPPSQIAMKGPKTDKIEDFPSVDDVPPLEDAMTVVVKTVSAKGRENPDGLPLAIFLRRPAEAAPEPLVDEDVPLEDRMKQLARDMKKIAAEPGQNKANIKIEGDGELRHVYLMQAYDACKQAGFQNVSFVAPPREGPAVEKN